MPSCDECGFDAASEKGLSIHQSQIHDSGGKKKTYECAECGDTFEDYPSRREGRGRENFFCSRECKNNFEEKEKYYFNCANCGSEVVRHPSLVDQMGDYEIRNHFCNKDCESEWKSQNWVKDGHPNWVDREVITMYGQGWLEAREKAILNDGEVCTECGMSREEQYEKYGRDFDVHHLKPVHEFENIEDAHFLENLVTVCKGCHMRIERSN